MTSQAFPPPARLILHGRHNQNGVLRQSVRRLREEGHQLEVRVSWEPGDFRVLAWESGRLGQSTVIAAGGDGTIREVVAGLLDLPREERPTLGILPLGTANDFANGAGLFDEEPLDLLLHTALTGPISLIDVARCNGEAFLNLASAGQVAQVTTGANPGHKGLLGKLAYMISGMKFATVVESWPVRLQTPDFQFEGSILALFVGNGRTAGGGYQVCPTALLDDGQLEVTIVPEVPLDDVITLSTKLLAGGTVRDVEFTRFQRVSELEMQTYRDVQINLDGEPFWGNRFAFEIEPQCLRVRLGPTPPLVGQADEAAD